MGDDKITAVTRQDFEACASAEAAAARAIQAGGKRFSDITDDQGHQYIDLVMEGGGTLGIALLGYIHVLEQAGLRFLGIGGTSAGAVSAVMLAAAAAPGEQRLGRLVDVLANMPMDSFIDGQDDTDTDARDAVYAWLEHKNLLAKVWTGGQVIDNLLKLKGLNRGKAFQEWVRAQLAELNGGQPMTVADLRLRMTAAPELWVDAAVSEADCAGQAAQLFETLPDGRRRYKLNRGKDMLVVVATDISTGVKAEFPRMAPLYWPEPERVDIAEFARASMSIPGFFMPYSVPSMPCDAARALWQTARPDWPQYCFQGSFLPKEHHFMDGGVLSNFPIHAFHAVGRVPLRPTFGVKLQYDEHKNEVKNVFDVLTGSFGAARGALDADFIDRNPDFRRLVGYIDTGTLSWLDFEMSREHKLELFLRGARSALAFLKGFDWQDYKRVRRLLRDAAAAQV